MQNMESMEDIASPGSMEAGFGVLDLRRVSGFGPNIASEFVEPCGGVVGSLMGKFWARARYEIRRRRKTFGYAIKGIWCTLILAYIIGVIYTYVDSGSPAPDWCSGYGFALLLFIFIVWCLVYYRLLKPHVLHDMSDYYYDTVESPRFKRGWRYLEYGVLAVLAVALLAYAVVDTYSERRRLISLLGWAILILIGFVFSKHPDFIRWPTVIKGLALQFIVGFITVKWDTGRSIFVCIGHKVEGFLEFAYSGAAFVYGDLLVNKEKVFVFQALSVLFFVAMFVQVLSYYGWLQVACLKVGSIIQFILGSTIIESVNAVTTIFLGMSEAPFIYNTYVKDLTKSELHAISAACMAAVAGSLLAAYASVGADPSLIVTASSMAAPGALGFAKLFYPENRKTRTSTNTISLHKSEDTSVMDAACKGAFSAIQVVSGIVASLIACISFIAFIDGILGWLGLLLGAPYITFEYLVGKIFIPLAWLMGVTPSQVEDVGRLIGLKSTVNEFVAYKELGVLKAAGKLTPRSEAIATFALCGFANPGSVSMMIATLASFAPNQRQNVISVAARSFISGSITSFMSACIVGLMMPEYGFERNSLTTYLS